MLGHVACHFASRPSCARSSCPEGWLANPSSLAFCSRSTQVYGPCIINVPLGVMLDSSLHVQYVIMCRQSLPSTRAPCAACLALGTHARTRALVRAAPLHLLPCMRTSQYPHVRLLRKGIISCFSPQPTQLNMKCCITYQRQQPRDKIRFARTSPRLSNFLQLAWFSNYLVAMSTVKHSEICVPPPLPFPPPHFSCPSCHFTLRHNTMHTASKSALNCPFTSGTLYSAHASIRGTFQSASSTVPCCRKSVPLKCTD